MPDLSPSELKRLLQGQCPGLIHELCPGARREGRLYSAPNPTRGADGHGSFKIWPNGAWREYDDDESNKGDILGLVAYVGGHAPKSREGRRYAISWARKRLGLEGGDKRMLAAARRKASKEAEERRLAAEREEAARAFRIKMRVKDIWRGAKPLSIDPPDVVTLYLRGRGIDLAAIPRLNANVLRCHPGLRHWTSDHFGPAMIAAVISPTAGFIGVHCTFLAADGGKARLNNPKLMLGAIKGGVVPLAFGPSGLTGHELFARKQAETVAVGEGIETMLAVAAAEVPAMVWAALSLSNIANAPVDLACVSSVIFVSENDAKPQAIMQRESVWDALARHGKPLVDMRPHLGSDFNDLIKE
jgi:hypothetical protein